MKFNLAAIVFCIFLLLVIGNINAAARPRTIISGFSIKSSNNNSANVGEDFTLQIKLSNVGDTCALSTTISVQPGYPFILKGVSTSYPVDVCNNINNQTIVEIPMTVDPTASGGSYQLMLTTYYSDWMTNTYTSTDSLNILVSGSPDLNAHIINSVPVDIYPGDNARLSVLLENSGTYQAQYINAVLSSENVIEIKPTNSFAYVSSLDSKQSTPLDFSIDVPKNADAKDYIINLNLKYLDENRQSQSKSILLNLSVKKKAIFQTSDYGKNLLFANDVSKIVHVNLENIGTDVAKNMKIKIQPQFPFTTDGSVRYIDELDPGKSSVVDFVVNVDKDATVGIYSLDLIIDFEDKQGNILHDNVKKSLTVQNKGILRFIFIDNWFLCIVVLIAAIFIFMKNKRFSGEREKLKDFFENISKKNSKQIKKK